MVMKSPEHPSTPSLSDRLGIPRMLGWGDKDSAGAPSSTKTMLTAKSSSTLPMMDGVAPACPPPLSALSESHASSFSHLSPRERLRRSLSDDEPEIPAQSAFDRLEARLLEAVMNSERRMSDRMNALESNLKQQLRSAGAFQPPSGSDGRPGPSKETADRQGQTLHQAKASTTAAGVRRASASGRGRRAGARRPSISGDSDSQQVWALVEDDLEIKAMLKNVRKDIDSNAVHESRHQVQKAKSKRNTNRKSTSDTEGEDSEDTDAQKNSRLSTRFPAVNRYRSSRMTATSDKMARSSMGTMDVGATRLMRLCRFCCGPVLHPDSRFRSVWNLLLGIFIVYCGIAVPLEIAFEEDIVESMCGYGSSQVLRSRCSGFLSWFYLNVLVDMWFIIDIIVNFRTGYMHEGHFVSDDWLTIKNYLKGSFAIDFLGSFPLNLFLMLLDPENPYGDPAMMKGTSGGGDDLGRINRLLRLLRLTKLAKLARMFKLAKYMEYLEMIVKFNPGLLRIIKLAMSSLLCCHWFGCVWWLISDLEIQDMEIGEQWYAGQNTWHPPTWLKEEHHLGTKYMHAFFWGAGMVTSMVPKDIEPVTQLEAIVTVFTMFFGLMLNAFVISSFTTAFAALDAKKELAGKQMDTIRNYCVVKKVPSDLRGRILEFYEYKLTSSESIADSHLLDQMPPNLSAQLALTVNRRLIARCRFFNDVSNTSLVSLMKDLRPLVFVPMQLIVTEGHVLTSVYFINRGLVQLIQSGEQIGALSDADNFGLEDYRISASTGDPAIVKVTAKAVTYCDVMSLTMDELSVAIADDELFQSRIRGPLPAIETKPKHSRKQSVLRAATKLGLGAAVQGGRRLTLQRNQSSEQLKHEVKKIPTNAPAVSAFAAVVQATRGKDPTEQQGRSGSPGGGRRSQAYDEAKDGPYAA